MRMTTLLTVTMIVLMFAHVGEIGVWAWLLRLDRRRAGGLTPFEFAFENYTALGYGEPTRRRPASA